MINKYMNECCPELQVQTALYQENSCNIRSIGENHIYEIRFSGRSADEKRESEDGIELVFSVPMIGIEYQWHPVCGFDHALKADWSQDICTMTSFSAPVMSFYDGEGTNRLTFALSELKKNVRLNAGVHEEDGTLRIRIRILADDLVMNEVYGLKIYMDFKAHAYYKALDEVRKWWEDSCGIVPAEVPEAARYPMYSTWYSFHQDVSAEKLEKEAAKAKEYGFTSIIVDDGWQTDDLKRGYGFCGDWEVVENKFPDMHKHVENIHKMGMKMMLWFSVPFLGIHAKHWESLKDKIIYFNPEIEAGVLDIRYPEIREYLTEIYVRAVRDWGIDGLKLDFIDEFYFRNGHQEKKEGMDFSCLQEALDDFLLNVLRKLKEINPQIMIEFRQRYIGPNIRKYGNIFRVTDCPNSGISNRTGSIDLRILSGNTAVHSDMIMWNPGETVENAALQIVNSLFCTLQFSVKIDELGEEHQKMVKYWTKFMSSHIEILQKSPIHVEDPQGLYPIVWSGNEQCRIIAVYERNKILEYPCEIAKTIVVRGTQEGMQVFKAEKSAKMKIKVLDCCGKIKREESLEVAPGYFEVFMGQADTLILERA